MESHSSDVFRPFSAARVQARAQRPLPLTARMKARQSSKIRELAEAVKSAGFLTLDEKRKHWGSLEAPLGPFARLAIKLPAFQRRSSIACWPRRSCQRLPEPRSSNTSRKKLPAYMAAAGVNAVSSPPGFQSRNRRYAGKLNPLQCPSTTGSPLPAPRPPAPSPKGIDKVRVHSPTSRSGSRIYLSIWDLFWALVSPILALHLRDVDVNADWSVIANYWVLSAGFAILAFFAFRLQDGMTRYFSVHEALDIAEAVLFAELMTFAVLF